MGADLSHHCNAGCVCGVEVIPRNWDRVAAARGVGSGASFVGPSYLAVCANFVSWVLSVRLDHCGVVFGWWAISSSCEGDGCDSGSASGMKQGGIKLLISGRTGRRRSLDEPVVLTLGVDFGFDGRVVGRGRVGRGVEFFFCLSALLLWALLFGFVVPRAL